MKRILIVLIILLIAAGLVACANPMQAAISQMAENNDAENSSDSGTEDNADEGQADINVSDNGSSIEITGEDGNATLQGDENGMAWPSDKLPSSVPEISGVKVVMVLDMDEGVMVAFENCDKAAAEAYIAKLKSAGWATGMELNADDGYTGFFTKGNESISFGWSTSDLTGSLIYGVSQ